MIVESLMKDGLLVSREESSSRSSNILVMVIDSTGHLYHTDRFYYYNNDGHIYEFPFSIKTQDETKKRHAVGVWNR